jgi:hypothetical protein
MKIQFIIIGWHYFPDYINDLIELKTNNDNVNVFWVCRKEPPQIVKDNFDWKIFDNVGLEWGGYNQGASYLTLDDDDVIFFTHDDIIIKDWNFLNICLSNLSQFNIIGNGLNYGFNLDPNAIITPNNTEEVIPYGSINTWLDVATTKELFDIPLHCKTIRGSFICTTYSSFKRINGFDYIIDPYDGKMVDLQWANIMVNLNGYKYTRVFGHNKIGYLSNTYADSDFIYELERGKI